MDDGAVRGRPKVIQIELDSGVICQVTPLNLWAYQALQDAATAKYPDPDKAPYETAIENAATPDVKLPAEDNPDYLKALAEAHGQRVAFMLDWLTRRHITFPEGETTIRERFAGAVADLKELKPDLDVDDWTAFLKFFVITPAEFSALMAILQDQFPVTEAESRDGFRLFQLQIQWGELVRYYRGGSSRRQNTGRLERLKEQLAETRRERRSRGTGGDQPGGDEPGTVLSDESTGSDSDGQLLPGFGAADRAAQ